MFNGSWGPFQPRNFMPSNGRSHFGDPLALQGSIFDWFLDCKFRIELFNRFVHRFVIDVGSILVPCWFRFAWMFASFLELRFCIDIGSISFQKWNIETSKNMVLPWWEYSFRKITCSRTSKLFHHFLHHWLHFLVILLSLSKGVPIILDIVKLLVICFRTLLPFTQARPTSARNPVFQLFSKKH